MKKGIKKLWNKIKKFFKAKDGDDNKFSITEVCLIILCTTIISILVGILLDKSLFRSDNKYSAQLKELINNYQYIVNSYYGEVDENKLVDAAISGIVNELGDTYSNYFSESQAENFDKMLTGSYEGIGVQIGQYTNGDIVVVSVFENSSAYDAGVKVGDIIKKINGKELTGLSTKDAVKIIKEQTGEKINLNIIRDKEEKQIEVIRKKVVLKSVNYETLEKNNKKVGYIYISIFSLNTSVQVKEALEQLEGKVDSIIIDVSDNSGGHLTSAEEMQEKYGAKVVGVNSFGKGTFQEKVELSTGASYKVTTKKWLSPNGVWINEVGVTPDVYIEGRKEWYNLSHDKDVQLQKALEEITK